MTPSANHTEICAKCRGKGIRYFRIDGALTQQPCKPCAATGERTYAASAEKRAHTNAMAKARKERKLAESVAAFRVEYPRVWAWMVFSGEGTFGAKMQDALLKWGGLTEKQMAASLKCVRRDA